MPIPDYQALMRPLLARNLGVTRKEVYEVKQFDSDYFNEEN